MAEEFMFGLMERTTRECTRPNRGARLRFNAWNLHFGSASSLAPTHLKTYHIVRRVKVNLHPTAEAYFGWECGRIDTWCAPYALFRICLMLHATITSALAAELNSAMMTPICLMKSCEHFGLQTVRTGSSARSLLDGIPIYNSYRET